MPWATVLLCLVLGAVPLRVEAIADDHDSPGRVSPATTMNTTSSEVLETEHPTKAAKRRAGRTAASPKTEEEIEHIVVEAKKPLTAASADEIRARDYEMRPHATTQEILNNVPGLVVAQHQGGGKATQYLIRGFDADHGSDFAVFVDDLPVNLVTHAHGQGYADLNFLIPETVEGVHLFKGPYFEQFGDFANAGALQFVTKDEVPGTYARAEGGSFDTQRYVAMASPKLSWAKSLLAAQAYFTNGPFEDPQHYARYNVFTKFTLTPSADSTLALSGSIYNGDWDGSGQIPRRVVLEGVLLDPLAPGGERSFGRFDAIDPSEGGSSDREDLNLHYRYTPSAQDEWAFQLYGSRYKLRLFSNFTFFRDTGLRFVQRAPGAICDRARGDCGGSNLFVPGDGIEQNDQRELYGARVRYTRNWALGGRPAQSQIAIDSRNDEISVALHRQVQRQRFFTINQVSVAERSVSGFMHHEIFLSDAIRFEAGLRGDVFFVDGHSHLPAGDSTDDRCDPQTDPTCDPNFTAVPIAGHLIDSIVSPKANLIVTPLPDTDLYFNFGTGFHSNDARNALLARSNPQQSNDLDGLLVRSLAYEVGARTRQFDRLDLAAALWLMDLDSELVFSGDAGNQETGAGGSFEPSPATRRWGIDFEARYRIADWLFADYDLSYADPRYRASGDAIPLAPTLLMNGGLTAEFANGFSAALRTRFLDDRPAIEDRSLTASGYTLIDLIARYRWRNLEVSLALLNLLDTDWREAQFGDNTCVYSEAAGGTPGCSRAPGKQDQHATDPPADLHFTPGNPFGVRAGVTWLF
ncbi:MAG: TonB-dependent receptor [Candidatus Binatia bacterium]